MEEGITAPGQTGGRLTENRQLASGAVTARHKVVAQPAIQTWIEAIQLYRFPLGIAVVLVHCGEFALTAGTQPPGASQKWVIEFLIHISRLATPSFLVIAGVLFFRNGPPNPEAYRAKIKSRVQTLLMPYAAWNLVAVLVLCAPSALNHFLSLAHPNYSLAPIAWAKWFVGWPIYPADAPLWFVRDLLLLALLAPLVRSLPRKLMAPGIIILGAYWLAGPVNLVPGGIPRASSVFFFALGAWLGMNQGWLNNLQRLRYVALTACTIFMVAAMAAAMVATWGSEWVGPRQTLERIVRVSGVFMVVFGATHLRIPRSWTHLLQRLSPVSFFLFASHYCFMVWAVAVWRQLPAARNFLDPVVLFLLLSTCLVALSVGSYYWLRRNAPTLLCVLDGNRSSAPAARGQGEKALITAPEPTRAQGIFVTLRAQ